QRIIYHKASGWQAANSARGAVNDACQLRCIFGGTSLGQTRFCLFRGEPSGVTVKLFRRAVPQHLTEMGVNYVVCLLIPVQIRFVQFVLEEGDLLNPPVNSRFLECLERCGLRMSQPRLRTALWKRPTSTPRADKQELDISAQNSEADRGDQVARAATAVGLSH